MGALVSLVTTVAEESVGSGFGEQSKLVGCRLTRCTARAEEVRRWPGAYSGDASTLGANEQGHSHWLG